MNYNEQPAGPRELVRHKQLRPQARGQGIVYSQGCYQPVKSQDVHTEAETLHKFVICLLLEKILFKSLYTMFFFFLKITQKSLQRTILQHPGHIPFLGHLNSPGHAPLDA